MKRSYPPVSFRLLVSMAFVLSVSAVTGSAAVYTYSFTLDLSSSTVQAQGGNEFTIFGLPDGQPTFTLSEGDSLVGTVTFANNQRLEILDPSGSNFEYLYFPFPRQGFDTTWTSSTVSLVDVTGFLSGPNYSYQPNQLGGGGVAQFFGITPSEVSFAGFNYEITINPNSGNGIYQASNLQIYAAANSVRVLGIPEPSAWALISTVIAGLCLLRTHRYMV